MIKILDGTTKYPLQKIGYNAGVCWGADVSDVDKNIKRAISCINSGHHRTLEYVDIELVIDGYSARVIREWYTHIAGGPTRLQESTRYINEANFQLVTPKSVGSNKIASDIYIQASEYIKESYQLLLDSGVPKEDAAMILPLGMTTKIVDKRNLRSFMEMSYQRLCTRAYWEYRELMHDIISELKSYSEEWSWICEHLFKPKCEVFGFCVEDKCCGRKSKKDA